MYYENKLMCFYDAYLIFNSDRNKHKNTNFICYEGGIKFYQDNKVLNNEALIYSVEINKHLRRKGYFTKFIRQLYDDSTVRKIGILGVGSIEMDKCIQKINFNGNHFFNHGGDYIFAKDFNICKCHKYVNVAYNKD